MCIVNFARGSWYPRGQQRLLRSACQHGFSGEYFMLQSESELGCPYHADVPYAFKVYAIAMARRMGYDLVFYFDASVFVVKPLQPLIDHVTKEGYFFQSNGHMTGPWCKDSALVPLGVTRDQLFLVPAFSAGCIGLDFRRERTTRFFDQWLSYAEDGFTFTGAWTNDKQEVSSDPRVRGHRHDQTVASVIAHRLGMVPVPDRTFMAYVGTEYAPPPESVVLHLCPA